MSQRTLSAFMKLTSVCLVVCFSMTCAYADSLLVQRGQSDATIVLPSDASPELAFAAKDLQYHLERMSGARLELTHKIKDGKPAIILDRSAIEQGALPPESDRNQGFRILAKNGRVLIAGASQEGTSNGIYTFLRNLGCDWVMPGQIGEIIPRLETIVLPDQNIVSTPSFFFRDLGYRGGSRLNSKQDLEEMRVWLQRQRMRSGKTALELGAGHFWQKLIKKYPEEFERNPEMLALVRRPDGTLERRGPQIESTNPEVIKLIARHIRAEMERLGLPKDAVAAFPFGPADGLGYSVSAESQLADAGRVDPLMGDPDTTDLLVLLGNQVLQELGDEYPNVELGFYSYSTHADYPMRYEPDPRLNVIFAPINFSRFHGVFDANSKTRSYYKRVVELWGNKHLRDGNKLAYRGYNWNLAENMVPYSMLRMLGEELPWYFENGIRYIRVEGTKAWSINAAHDYLLARMSWDVTLPWKEVLREFCEKSYGTGAEKMMEYFLMLTERQHAAGQEAGSFHAIHLIYDQDFVDESRKLLAGAEAAATEPEQRERIGFIGMGIEALRLYLEYFASTTRFDFPMAKRHYNAMLVHWEKCHAVNSQLVAKEVPEYLKRFIERFVNDGLRYSSGDYRMVAPLPDEMKTMLDPNNVGEKLNFQGPDLNDALYFKTRTWSAPWDAQGLAAYRKGAIWYRHEFDVENWKDNDHLGLFIGGVEDEVAVWLNGRSVGTSGRRFSVPFTFDLTEHLNKTGENVLALKVVRHSAANEIGLGGIIRPSFLFAGPRLEQPVPNEGQERHRILPGGEIDTENTE